ncbi:DUF4352 domain-containing protein [Halosimplex pelagicum]|uniref:DUF4352 domain-containing protein n=1 Tax=Halosimplex pelagicum TaxID=869886 RepID=A0A7D5TWM8_9EURY|nr:DUF4352 domain-containing protein [Halosimplex pelagicum]QLH84987.1 DUF4352 domain-containing protein [Halosimplex pelagicum]QLH84992.1 DUF4352 domain-containing protein [Halosimplex pelagicum]
MATKYCPNCGADIGADVKFCPECGTDVSHLGADNDPSGAEASDGGGRSVGAIIAYLGGAILLFLGLGAVTMNAAAGLILLAAGAFALPPTRSKLAAVQGTSVTGATAAGVVIVAAIVGMGVLGATAPATNDGGGGGDGSSPAATATPTPTPEPVSTSTPAAPSTPTVTPTATATPTAPPEPTPTATPKPSPTPVPDRSHQVAEQFVVGDGGKSIRYRVADLSVQSSVGGEYISEEADGEFIVIDLSMTNVANESVSVSSNLYTLVDSQGREYDVDTDAMAVVENPVIFEQLDPGVGKDGVLIYDVPTDQTGRELHVEPAGTFSSASTHTVDLESG